MKRKLKFQYTVAKNKRATYFYLICIDNIKRNTVDEKYHKLLYFRRIYIRLFIAQYLF